MEKLLHRSFYICFSNIKQKVDDSSLYRTKYFVINCTSNGVSQQSCRCWSTNLAKTMSPRQRCIFAGIFTLFSLLLRLGMYLLCPIIQNLVTCNPQFNPCHYLVSQQQNFQRSTTAWCSWINQWVPGCFGTASTNLASNYLKLSSFEKKKRSILSHFQSLFVPLCYLVHTI